MSNFDELRTEALRKAETAHGFSGRPTAFYLISIERALRAFPPRPDRASVDPTQKFGRVAVAGRIMLRQCHDLWMRKVKTLQYQEKLKQVYADSWQYFWE